MSSDRNTNIMTALFDVAHRELFMDVPYKDRDGNPKTLNKKVERFQALVDVEKEFVFAVTSDNYKLITNYEAIELGKECFKKVFSKNSVEGMELFNITMPTTRSFCLIDYVHRENRFEFSRNDDWSPFLRITNSYNKTKPLRFEMGFCRWICSNGLIFGKKSITFKFMHSKSSKVNQIHFETNFGEVAALEKEFLGKLHNLKRFSFPQRYIFPMICKFMGVNPSTKDLQDNLKRNKILQFKKHVLAVTEKYYNEMDPDGYAALNVITDLASRPQELGIGMSGATMVDTLQKRCGEWTDEFINLIKSEDFSFDKYLGDSQRISKIILDLSA